MIVIEKKATIKDVAREAGVALSTVSNALNDSNLVTEQTRNKVLAAAEKLNYVPNINGRVLKSGKSKMLCFLTSHIKGEYFGRLLDMVSESCFQKGYGLDIVVTWEERVIRSQILGGRFDGIFVFEGKHIQEEELDRIHKERIAAVFLDRHYQEQKAGCVLFDSYEAGYEVTRHLINLGHRRFGFVDSMDNYDCMERKRGFCDALQENGLEYYAQDIVQGYCNENIAYSAILAQANKAKLNRDSLPTAIVCGNDLSAIGTIKALKILGYRVPEDISVVGFDDIEIAQYFTPSLTTVRNPIEKQGRCAVEAMVNMLEENKPGDCRILKGTLIPRNSSGICHNS